MARGDGAGDHLRRLGDVQTARRLQHTPQGDVGQVAVVRETVIGRIVDAHDRHPSMLSRRAGAAGHGVTSAKSGARSLEVGSMEEDAMSTLLDHSHEAVPHLDPETADAVERAVDALSGRRIAVLTGAGVSTDSGIPDYRGKGAHAPR
jgi:hypothetical protein